MFDITQEEAPWLVTEVPCKQDTPPDAPDAALEIESCESAIQQSGWRYDYTLSSIYAELEPSPFALSNGTRTVWIQWMNLNHNPSPGQIECLDTISDDSHNEVFLIRPNQEKLVMDILDCPGPYHGLERWARNNHWGLVETKSQASKFSRWFKKARHGECPHCHEILTEMPGWDRHDCPQCGRHFYL